MAVRTPIGVVNKVAGAPTPITGTTDTRLGLGSLLKRVAGIRPKQGIIRADLNADLEVQGTPGWAYLVQQGAVVIAPDAASGAYIIPNDAVETVPTIAAPGTGSRIDIIYIQAADAWDRSLPATAAVLACANGASTTGTPTAPVLPDGAIEIARNVMTSAATTTSSAGNTITQTIPYTQAAGGVQFYRTAAEVAAGGGDRNVGDVFYEGTTHTAGAATSAIGGTHLLARALGNGVNGGNVMYSVPDLTAMASITGMIEGDYADINALDCLYRYSGGSWVQATPARLALWADLATQFGGSPAQGTQAWIKDTLYTYYAVFSGGNTTGAFTAGWYPTGGQMPMLVADRLANIGGGTGVWASMTNWAAASLHVNRSPNDVGVGGPDWVLGAGADIGVPFPGIYDVSIHMDWAAAGAVGARYTRLAITSNPWPVNTAEEISRNQAISGATAAMVMTAPTAIESLCQVQGYQDTGGTINMTRAFLQLTFKAPRQIS